MKLRGREKNKVIIISIISIIVFVLFACFITLIINISFNKGIIPAIFFLLMIYSLLMFLYNLLYNYQYNKINIKTTQIKISYILFFIINLLLFLLSYISIWY